MSRIARAMMTALHLRPAPRGLAHWYYYHNV
jgi:hypothetical protein